MATGLERLFSRKKNSGQGALCGLLRARPLAEDLRVTYRYSVEKVLLPFCGREGIADVADLDQDALDRLSVQLQEGKGTASGRALSKLSVNSYLNAVNVFLSCWRSRKVNSSDREI